MFDNSSVKRIHPRAGSDGSPRPEQSWQAVGDVLVDILANVRMAIASEEGGIYARPVPVPVVASRSPHRRPANVSK